MADNMRFAKLIGCLRASLLIEINNDHNLNRLPEDLRTQWLSRYALSGKTHVS